MLDRRVVPGLLAGSGGLLLGVVAALWSVPALAVLAGACAVAAGAWAAALVRAVRRAERSAVESATKARVIEATPGAKQAPSLLDADTGLPDARFFALAVECRVATGRRRLWPVTVVLLQVDPGPRSLGGHGRDDAMRSVAGAAQATLRESDIVCRTGETSLGVVLEDTTEEGGVSTAERIQKSLSPGGVVVRRLAAGVATYPNHGLRAEEVTAAARSALTRACTRGAGPGEGVGRVEVAEPDFA